MSTSTAEERIQALSEHLRPVERATKATPPRYRRIAIKVRWAHGVEVAGWLMGVHSSRVSDWVQTDTHSSKDLLQTMNNDDVSTRLGTTLRDLREMRGWIRTELAEMTGISADSIYRCETGRATPSLEYLRRLSDVFDCKPSDLLQDAGL